MTLLNITVIGAENAEKQMPERTLKRNVLLPEALYSGGESSVVSEGNEARPLLWQVLGAAQWGYGASARARADKGLLAHWKSLSVQGSLGCCVMI